jgi:predicted SnoaL-like aldol condensation-catalyzing enzyme
MTERSQATETVIRNHLQAFLERRGVAAIVEDYGDDARFYTGTKVYRGKAQIGDFFTEFLGSMPAEAVEEFSLKSLRIDGDLAYITWSAGAGIPLGTDTFVVNDGKIVRQTFAMYTSLTDAGSASARAS